MQQLPDPVQSLCLMSAWGSPSPFLGQGQVNLMPRLNGCLRLCDDIRTTGPPFILDIQDLLFLFLHLIWLNFSNSVNCFYKFISLSLSLSLCLSVSLTQTMSLFLFKYTHSHSKTQTHTHKHSLICNLISLFVQVISCNIIYHAPSLSLSLFSFSHAHT